LRVLGEKLYRRVAGEDELTREQPVREAAGPIDVGTVPSSRAFRTSLPSAKSTRAPTYAITTTSRHGKTKPKKNCPVVGGTRGGCTANETAAITGTLLDAASAASTDRRGELIVRLVGNAWSRPSSPR
jgi:hypothetical protein